MVAAEDHDRDGKVSFKEHLMACVDKDGRTAFRRCEDCRDLATCALREALLRARDATAAVLEGYSLADAAQGAGAELIEG